MKHQFFLTILFISINSIFSQKSNHPISSSNSNSKTSDSTRDYGKIENGKFKCNLFKWSIEIPSEFTISTQERIKQLEDQGITAIKENSSYKKIKSNEIVHLIGFEKEKYTTFNATYQSLEGTQRISLEEHKNFSSKLITETYTRNGFKIDIQKNNLKLGIHNFYNLKVHLINPQTNQLILTQEVYTAYINDHLFTAVLCYKDENLGKILISKFVTSFD
ncbi:hypothetical protein [Flavobacterium sp. GCM10027622]|uniref:hypothetical protein n=1 Tax=unclassified Flavobacterium TaxID=196869 RepID=UPI0036108073